MNVERIETGKKVIPFQRKERVSTVTLQINGCNIHGVPASMSLKELQNLITTAHFITSQQIKNYWFNENMAQQLEAVMKGGDQDEVKTALSWLKDYLTWRFDSAKLLFFNTALEKLPMLHQQIITKKYLMIDSEGKQQLDDFVYGELHIGRTYYYKKKKEALHLLGKELLRT